MQTDNGPPLLLLTISFFMQCISATTQLLRA